MENAKHARRVRDLSRELTRALSPPENTPPRRVPFTAPQRARLSDLRQALAAIRTIEGRIGIVRTRLRVHAGMEITAALLDDMEEHARSVTDRIYGSWRGLARAGEGREP